MTGTRMSEADMLSTLSNTKDMSAFDSSEPLGQSSISMTASIVPAMALIPD